MTLPNMIRPVLALLLAAAAPAAAQDATEGGVKAPPPATAPKADSWAGLYAGVSLGGKVASNQWTTTSIYHQGLGGLSGIDQTAERLFGGAGLRAGGYAGYNVRLAPLIIAGIEADLAYSDHKEHSAGIPGCTIECWPGVPGPQQSASSVADYWDGSVRGRLGYLLTPTALLYGTGGVAWQSLRATASCIHNPPDPFCLLLPGNPPSQAAVSSTRLGWTAGVGLDWKLATNWIARVEYRYSDFGTQSGLLDLTAPGTRDWLTYRLDSSTQIVTVGLAYRFGS